MPDIWAVTSVEDIVDTACVVVGPDEPFGGRSHEDMEADHWAHLTEVLRQQGIVADALELKRTARRRAQRAAARASVMTQATLVHGAGDRRDHHHRGPRGVRRHRALRERGAHLRSRRERDVLHSR